MPTDLDAYQRVYKLEHAVTDARARQAVNGFLRPFVAFCAGRDPTAEILKDWRAHLLHSMKASSRNRYMKAVKAYLSYLHDVEGLKLTPEEVARILKPFKEPSRIPHVWDSDQLRKLLPAVVTHANRPKRENLGIGVLLMLCAGLRPGEAISLRRQDIDLKHSWMNVFASKTQKERRIPLDSPALLDLFSRLWKKREPEETWFKPGNNYRQIPFEPWRELLQIAKLKKEPPKILRATHVAHVASSHRFSTYELTGRFGHSEKISHQFYYQPMPDVQGDNVDQWLGCAAELQKLVDHIVRAEFKVE